MSIANGVVGARLRMQRSRLVVLGAVVEAKEARILDVAGHRVDIQRKCLSRCGEEQEIFIFGEGLDGQRSLPEIFECEEIDLRS